MEPITFAVPTPPSVNKLFANRRGPGKARGRYKTQPYKNWIATASGELVLQKAHQRSITGRYKLSIVLPRIRGDADNRIKALSDFCVAMCLVDDDRYCDEISVKVDRTKEGLAYVTITPIGMQEAS